MDFLRTDMALKRSLNGMRVAILHQSAPVPAVGGVNKPMKPGGELAEGFRFVDSP